jgi:hypothetical protein
MNFQASLLTGLIIANAVIAMAKESCQANPVNIVIVPAYSFGGTSATSLIFPESGAPYSNGASGVSAYINAGCTGDLILNLKDSTRAVGWSFQNPVASDGNTPSWTATPFVSKGDNLVVADLLYQYNPAGYYQFTTSAAFDFTAPDGSYGRITFANPFADVDVPEPNQPYNTALVVVTHSPANPSTGAIETWTIAPSNANTNPSGTPAATQVGTLLLNTKHGSTNGGEFSLPFQFTVTRQ